jgi:hypothetical protein
MPSKKRMLVTGGGVRQENSNKRAIWQAISENIPFVYWRLGMDFLPGDSCTN